MVVAGGVFVSWISQEPENVEIFLDAPIQVGEGDEVVIVVEVRNMSNSPQELTSIDIASDYLDGIAIQTTEPNYVNSYRSNYFGFDSQVFEFLEEIPPGETTSVWFFGKALNPGDYAGDLDVYIGSHFTTKIVRTIVQ